MEIFITTQMLIFWFLPSKVKSKDVDFVYRDKNSILPFLNRALPC